MLKRPLLAAAAILALLVPAAAASAQAWVPVWTASPTPDRKDGPPDAPLQFDNETVRQDIRLGASATALRFRISNELGAAPLRLGPASARLTGAPGPGRPVLFDGRAEVIVPPGAALVSDPVALAVPALGEVSFSLYVPEATRPAVRRTPVRVATGTAAVPDDVRLTRRQNVVSAVYAERAEAPTVIVALGDSITEGATATLGAHRDWPSVLAERFERACPGQVVVLNQGISGNRLLDHGRSPSALARLDRDVLALPGVDHVILLAGINDIRHGGAPAMTPGRDAADMILGYRQVVARLRDHGIRVIAGTLTPFEGSERFEPVAEGTRQALNAFIRDGGAFDGVIDFDAAVRDPTRPAAFAPGTARDDRLHPGDEGYRLMAEAVDLSLFGCTAP
ncbi:MAG: SGNH/GDSL hydrolase family protein [Pseudomonadota bacterium]|nr:SGNH/GDSL hydrolase family protein [Pseudomonadota bacterium]